MSHSETPFGFFGRAADEWDDGVAAGLTSKLAFRSKNQCDVTVSKPRAHHSAISCHCNQ